MESNEKAFVRTRDAMVAHIEEALTAWEDNQSALLAMSSIDGDARRRLALVRTKLEEAGLWLATIEVPR